MEQEKGNASEEKKDKKAGLFQGFSGRQKWGKDQFVVLVLLGILLLIIAIPVSDKESNKTMISSPEQKTAAKGGEDVSQQGNINTEENVTNSEIEEYESYLENKLEQILSEMEGAGKVKVVVTVSSSSEAVVEKDSPAITNHTTENDAQGGNRVIDETDLSEETVYEKNSSGIEKPFVVKTIQPVVEGVLVVAQGGGQEKIVTHITEGIVALFNIEPHKIKVVKMKTE